MDPIIDPSRKHCIPKECDEGSKYNFSPKTCKDPENCISAKNNWDTNFGGSSIITWIADTAGDNVDIYVDNDNILHYGHWWGYGPKGKPKRLQNVCELFYVTHPNKNANAIYREYWKSKGLSVFNVPSKISYLSGEMMTRDQFGRGALSTVT